MMALVVINHPVLGKIYINDVTTAQMFIARITGSKRDRMKPRSPPRGSVASTESPDASETSDESWSITTVGV